MLNIKCLTYFHLRKLKKGMGLKSTDNIPIGIQPRDKYLTGNVLFLLVKSSEVTQQKKLCNFSFVFFFFSWYVHKSNQSSYFWLLHVMSFTLYIRLLLLLQSSFCLMFLFNSERQSVGLISSSNVEYLKRRCFWDKSFECLDGATLIKLTWLPNCYWKEYLS